MRKKPTQSEPNEESAAIARRFKTEAATAYAAAIAADYHDIVGLADAVSSQTILAANKSRSIGFKLAAWMDREQMRFEAFEEFMHAAASQLPAGFDSYTARKFLSAHRNFPDEVKDLKTASLILNQVTFFAVGLMDEPKRIGSQKAGEVTPFHLVMILAGKLREALSKLLEEFPQDTWDDRRWTMIINETDAAAELNCEGRARLRLPPATPPR